MLISVRWWKTGISVRTYYIVSTRLKYIYLHSVNVAMTSSCLQITFWTVIPVNIKKKIHGLTREAKNKLLKYAWPGNVRELQHTIERAVILGDGSMLKPENFLFHATPKQKKDEEVVLNLEQLERQAIEKALRISNGNISRAAEYLGITRFALYRKLEKLGL